jgi:methylmalonyl-CoA mutase
VIFLRKPLVKAQIPNAQINRTNPRVYMRSLPRQSNLALSKYVADAIQVIKAAKYDIIILRLLESGSQMEIMDSDVSLYVMTPEFAATQLEKSTC